jgi:hypothetical protein
MDPVMKIRVTRLSVALVLAAGAAWAQDSIRPGYWESTETVVHPIETTKVERRCITPKDVARFMMGPSNHIYSHCAYPELEVGAGRMNFRGQCADKKGQTVRISAHGTFTATTLHLTADVTFKLLGIPITAQASTDARRIGDVCPPAAPK